MLAPFGAKAPPSEVGLQQVQQAGHGTEQQHSVPGAVQLDEQPVQHAQLATLPQQLCLVCPPVWWIAQGRVITHLECMQCMTGLTKRSQKQANP